jgi:Tol biopolymer transport system component
MRRWLVPVVGLALTGSASAAGSTRPPAGKLVFASNRTGSLIKSGIFVVGTDGRGLRRLTHTRVREYAPEWSPNRRHIAFLRGDYPRQALVVMDADGHHQRAIARGLGLGRPSWSPDSRRLVYTRYGQAGDSDIFIVGKDGRGDRALLATKEWAEGAPDWSRGNEIAFLRERVGTHANTISVVRVDGSGLRQLKAIPSEESIGGPAWSPDGRRIAISLIGRRENSDITPGDLYVLPGSGGPLRRVARRAQYPSWSPNGQWIAFSEYAGYPGAPGNRDALEIIRASGRGHRFVLLKNGTKEFDDTDPDWQPR